MRIVIWILAAVAFSFVACSPKKSDSSPPEELKPAPQVDIKKCILLSLPPKESSQSEWVVSGFDLVRSFISCQQDASTQENARVGFRTTMDGFAIPVENSPSQFRILAAYP